MKAVVFTLGCKVNETESNSLIAGLKAQGYEVSDRLEKADIYIVNTCAVTAEAEKKSRQTASRIKKLNTQAKIVFTGCAAEKNAKAFTDKSAGYLVTGVYGKNRIPQILELTGANVLPATAEYEEMDAPVSLKTRAYIKVQDGCDGFCSYCVIPYLRGRSRSRDPQKVLKEIEKINPLEAVINGINLSDYDYNGTGLTGLIRALSTLDCRIRLGSLEVRVIDEEFLSALKGLKNFAPHFHLSLQSGSNAVLRKMNRKYTRAEFIEKAELIKKFFPNAGITTDIIAGFPTETEEDFKETLSIIDAVGFTDIHPFPFSPREGTAAYKMPDLPSAVKKARLDLLLEKKAACKKAFAESQAGKTLDFLAEEYKNGQTEGYSQNYLRIYLQGDFSGKGIIKVKVLSPYLDGAKGEPIKENEK